MRIGISGAQGTGKTTLFRALKRTGIFEDSMWVESEIRSLVKLYGIPINEESNDLAQITIMDHFALNTFLYENLVSDRTPLDCLVYSLMLYEKRQLSQEVFTRISEVFYGSISLYDIHFYVQPEFSIMDDGTRSLSVNFQENFCSRCEREAVYNGIHLRLLSGSVDERVSQALEEISQVEKGESHAILKES
jgi:nicotinamide riboside kinase